MSLFKKLRRKLEQQQHVPGDWQLGEGSNREIVITAWPADGGPTLELRSGTQVDLFEVKRGEALPSGYPTNYAHNRVRLTSGEHKGRVVFVRAFQVQAVSAGG